MGTCFALGFATEERRCCATANEAMGKEMRRHTAQLPVVCRPTLHGMQAVISRGGLLLQPSCTICWRQLVLSALACFAWPLVGKLRRCVHAFPLAADTRSLLWFRLLCRPAASAASLSSRWQQRWGRLNSRVIVSTLDVLAACVVCAAQRASPELPG